MKRGVIISLVIVSVLLASFGVFSLSETNVTGDSIWGVLKQLIFPDSDGGKGSDDEMENIEIEPYGELVDSEWIVYFKGERISVDFESDTLEDIFKKVPKVRAATIGVNTIISNGRANSEGGNNDWEGIVRDHGSWSADVKEIILKKYSASGPQKDQQEIMIKIILENYNIPERFRGGSIGFPPFADKNVYALIYKYDYDYRSYAGGSYTLEGSTERNSQAQSLNGLLDDPMEHAIPRILSKTPNQDPRTKSKYDHYIRDNKVVWTQTQSKFNDILSFGKTDYMLEINGKSKEEIGAYGTASSSSDLWEQLPVDGPVDEIFTDETGTTIITRHEWEIISDLQGDRPEGEVANPAQARPRGSPITLRFEIADTATWKIKNGILIKQEGKDPLRVRTRNTEELGVLSRILGNAVANPETNSPSQGNKPYNPPPHEDGIDEAQKRMADAFKEVKRKLKIASGLKEFHECIERIVDRTNNLDKERINQIKSDLIDKWGPEMRDFLFLFDDEIEIPFIANLLGASNSASQGIHGTILTPEELASNFLMEGGIEIFLTKKEEYKFVKEDVGKEFNYYGTKVVVEESHGFVFIDPPIFVTPSFSIPKNIDSITINGKSYEVTKEGSLGYINYPDHTKKIVYGSNPGDIINIDSVDYEVFSGYSGNYIVIPFENKYPTSAIYSSKFTPTVIEFDGITIGEIEKSYGYNFVIPVEIYTKLHDFKSWSNVQREIDIFGNFEVGEIITGDRGKPATIRQKGNTDDKFNLFYNGDGDYYTIPERLGNYDNEINGASLFGLDTIGDFTGNKNEDGTDETIFDRLKKNGYVPDNIQIKEYAEINVDDRNSRTAVFYDSNSALTVLAGYLTEHKTTFINDYKNLENPFKPFDQLSSGEIIYWVSLYYNTGKGRGLYLLQQRNGNPKKGKKLDNLYSHNAFNNVALRTMLAELLKESKIFDEDCSKYLY